MGDGTVTRSQLYELIWSQPGIQLARQFGLSDVGLAKVCRRHNIPRPPRGYWAKKQVGKAPRQVPLPSSEDDEIVLACNKISAAESEQQQVDRGNANRPSIVVVESLRRAHPLVAETKDQLSFAREDDVGLLKGPEDLALNREAPAA